MTFILICYKKKNVKCFYKYKLCCKLHAYVLINSNKLNNNRKKVCIVIVVVVVVVVVAVVMLLFILTKLALFLSPVARALAKRAKALVSLIQYIN